eukprot:CAMPEP_0118976478 /NCGR_PEP_ID=MMETSP1173-20130426/18951_1 /TAXON_ID=1034831 /ORGANISM="Rhizochromulina marina cf, Strain CCMP1243" /LENGTH=337 /DNA_ID=CAMNT_0006926519 /DNA_START=11 /DNA_END=1024 /DNA_ORIENTATION=+
MAKAPKDKADGGGGAGLAKLLFGISGIYAAFMYYGLLQENVTKYTAEDGSRLERTWFLQTVEAFMNVVVGLLGMIVLQGGPSKNIPYSGFAITGASQVLAKALTQQAMIFGVSFPVATLAKSAKMVPVMIGSIILSGKVYPLRKYIQVALIVLGTVLVNMAKKKASGQGSEVSGLLCLTAALACDGFTGGLQDRMKANYKKTENSKLQPYDMMLFMNFFMCLVALTVSLAMDQFMGGLTFVLAHPDLAIMVFKFALCSAIGQSFVFFTIANFDPLVCSTVTTTRKIFSVLLSIFYYGHTVNNVGWAGIGVASLGILGELQEKAGGGGAHANTKKKGE